MSTPSPATPGAPKRLLWLALPVALLLILAGQQGLRDAQPRPARGPASEAGPKRFTIRIPADTGSSASRLLFEVFVLRSSSCLCHLETAEMGQAIGMLDPARIRVCFHEVGSLDAAERLRDLGADAQCQGFAINGKHRFRVPSNLPGTGPTRQVDFLAPARDWTVDDIHAALAQQYQVVYHKPFGLTRGEFARRVAAALRWLQSLRPPEQRMPAPG